MLLDFISNPHHNYDLSIQAAGGLCTIAYKTETSSRRFSCHLKSKPQLRALNSSCWWPMHHCPQDQQLPSAYWLLKSSRTPQEERFLQFDHNQASQSRFTLEESKDQFRGSAMQPGCEYRCFPPAPEKNHSSASIHDNVQARHKFAHTSKEVPACPTRRLMPRWSRDCSIFFFQPSSFLLSLWPAVTTCFRPTISTTNGIWTTSANGFYTPSINTTNLGLWRWKDGNQKSN
ncbi:uncharacterized protein TRIVIDRAFT_201114 [Trichoderma virens Gv29-8]|uniref:Uncharacterized protein n=1 Tax=Hypocrea virens (strain Gv29-8 / FGSC 10586) TaxID=413071 RepID=G9MRW9_HYPVG|nr:uncharacterized protein TRIVIDRAFT_201114 [Trichoderma virens Gv29-8]EHK22837.1 hypothetical protein TRIVIDRAFT_201114 [Trichoderma virens Gv29-8]